jgi:hypothetical protein
MIDDLGNKWREDEYEGYGVFGGKLFYDLAEEMKERLGYYAEPILTENPDTVWAGQHIEQCKFQGFFYTDYNEEELVLEKDEVFIAYSWREYCGDVINDVRTLRICNTEELQQYKNFLDEGDMPNTLSFTKINMPKDAKYLEIPTFRRPDEDEDIFVPNMEGARFVKSRNDAFMTVDQIGRSQNCILVLDINALSWNLKKLSEKRFHKSVNVRDKKYKHTIINVCERHKKGAGAATK